MFDEVWGECSGDEGVASQVQDLSCISSIHVKSQVWHYTLTQCWGMEPGGSSVLSGQQGHDQGQ